MGTVPQGLPDFSLVLPDAGTLGLGAANLASAFSGGYPVTGGFARSVVNFAAGAHTPLAGVVSALLMTLVIAMLTGLFFDLAHAVLAATIVVAVLGLVDLQSLHNAWRQDRADALSLVGTALGVMLLGVETVPGLLALRVDESLFLPTRPWWRTASVTSCAPTRNCARSC